MILLCVLLGNLDEVLFGRRIYIRQCLGVKGGDFSVMNNVLFN